MKKKVFFLGPCHNVFETLKLFHALNYEMLSALFERNPFFVGSYNG